MPDNKWSRKELQEYLENWGYAVYETESYDSLLEAAKQNFLQEKS